MKMAQKNRLEMPKNGENKVVAKPLKVGRPTLEESTTLTGEMERFAWDLSRGFNPAEIAVRMNIANEKAVRYSTTPIILERVRVLLGDKGHEWKSMQDELLTICYQTAISFVQQEKVPWQSLQWLLDRLEAQKGIYEKPKEGDAKKPIKKESDKGEEEKQGSLFDRPKQEGGVGDASTDA